MQALTRVSHEHHERLWSYVNQLNDLADCMNCLPSAGRWRKTPGRRPSDIRSNLPSCGNIRGRVGL